jgi:hypothetical protein
MQTKNKNYKKMYKSGKLWVVAGITGLSLISAVTIEIIPNSNVNNKELLVHNVDQTQLEAATVDSQTTIDQVQSVEEPASRTINITDGSIIKDNSVLKGSAEWANNSGNEQYATLVTSDKSIVGYDIYGTQLDGDNSWTITGHLEPTRLVPQTTDSTNTGDWLGVIIGPVDPKTMITGTVGGGLGIAKIPNALAFGIDMWQNSEYQDPKAGPFAGWRTTDSSGNLMVPSIDSDLQKDDVRYWNNQTGQEGGTINPIQYTITWTPDTNGTTGTITGTFSYVYNQDQYNIKISNEQRTFTSTKKIDNPKYFSVGLNASNGGMSAQQMAGSIASIQGIINYETVTVNYQDQDGNPLQLPNGSTISIFDANVGTTVGIAGISPNNATDDYAYMPAEIPGYYAISANDVTVSSTDLGQNQMTIVYEKEPQQAILKTDSSDPNGATTIETVSGVSDDKINFTKTDNDLKRDGYVYSIKAPNGDSYATLSEALQKNIVYDKTVNDGNTTDATPQIYEVTYTPVFQSAQIQLADGTTKEIATGVTNAPISFSYKDANLSKTGYSYKITGPDGQTYDTLALALSSNPNFDTTNNAVDATIDSSPQIFMVTYIPNPATVTYYYVDENGKTIADSQTSSGVVDAKVPDNKIDIFGYQFKEIQSDSNTIFNTDGTAKVTYIYQDILRPDARQDISAAETGEVGNEPDVINAIDALQTLVDSSDSSMNDINDAITALNTAVNDATTARTEAQNSAETALDSDDTETVDNEEDVKTAIKNLNEALKSGTTDQINSATETLKNTVSTSKTARDSAIANANTILNSDDVTKLKDKASVASAIEDLNQALKSGTTDQINTATATLKSAINDANTVLENAQKTIDKAENKDSSIPNISNEDDVKKATADLNDLLNNSASSIEQIATATDALNDEINKAIVARNDSLEKAFPVFQAMNESSVQNEPEVQEAFNEFNDLSNKLDITTADIISATNKLQVALDSATQKRQEALENAQTSISNAETSKVKNEADIATAIKVLNEALADPDITTAGIIEANEKFEATSNEISTARDTAEESADNLLDSVGVSNIKNETAVQEAYQALNDVLNNPDATTADIQEAMDDLKNASESATSIREQSVQSANQVTEIFDNSPVNNEISVIEVQQALENALSTATSEEIDQATAKLSDAIKEAQISRDEVKQKAEETTSEFGNSSVNNEPVVIAFQNILNEILNNSNSTTEDIQNAIDGLNNSIAEASQNKEKAKVDAVSTIDNAENSEVANEPDIRKAQEALETILNDPISTIEDINKAAEALTNQLSKSTTSKNKTVTDAQKTINAVKNNPILNADPTIKDELIKLEETLKTGTESDIKDALASLANAVVDVAQGYSSNSIVMADLKNLIDSLKNGNTENIAEQIIALANILKISSATPSNSNNKTDNFGSLPKTGENKKNHNTIILLLFAIPNLLIATVAKLHAKISKNK